MVVKRAVPFLLAGALALAGILPATGCGPSAEETITGEAVESLEAVKTQRPELMDALGADPALEGLGAIGVDARAFLSSYLAGFDYRIEDVSAEGDEATVTIVLTCKSMKAFNEELDRFAEGLASDESVPNMTQEELNGLVAQAAIETMEALSPAETAPIALSFKREEGLWKPAAGSEAALTGALLGT
ncbi:hypothetical protein [Rubneribacter sp.]